MWWMALGCVVRVDEWGHGAPEVPAVGESRLGHRSVYGYELATLSIEYGRVRDDEDVRNDWDLQFGMASDPTVDWFSVNMVTDDRSFLVDLGPVTDPAEVPLTLDPEDEEIEAYAAPDDLVVIEGHSYLVRTLDDDTTQWALVEVLAYEFGQTADLRWCRSDNPELFVAPAGCF
ncbi:MAG: hypothetical protein ABMA64_10535 [Myxococcota bacterium]